ncbi:MAG: DUF2804 domain-containing protein, partial [Spirochaetales bacterium]|nr:DUF2804 domain-containing protein [Spirochaetales bacterium]
MKLEQHEITNTIALLDENGNITEPGWARQSYYKYDRKKIKAPATRVKEWDYYCILSRDYGLALTAADNGYIGFFAVTFFDFAKASEVSGSEMSVLPLGKYNFPSCSDSGNVNISESKIKMSFAFDGKKRVLKLNYPYFNKNQGISAKIELTHPSSEIYDRMVIATPFYKNGHFYFNEKHNCLSAVGKVKVGDAIYTFGNTDKNRAWAVLDWGRGVWTYKNTWYWGSASGAVDGVSFGFNLGYGFGDTKAATENMLFYNGVAHKLDEVTFKIPIGENAKVEYLEPWKITSSDGRFEMVFKPLIDRSDDTNLLVIRSNQHQVFGYFSGIAVLD